MSEHQFIDFGSNWTQLLSLTEAELATVDPLLLNLLVGKSLPALSHLDVASYDGIVSGWAGELAGLFAEYEPQFLSAPADWKNDLDFFRLGMICWFLECRLNIRYIETGRSGYGYLYTDPGDLFVNGVIDRRVGTCANLAPLYVALAWRLSLPVSLALAGSHVFCRYDNGVRAYNIETTQVGYNGFRSDPDADLIREFQLPRKAVDCGSDLRALTHREMLGLFLSFRGRHRKDLGELAEAERDYLLARYLFPSSRLLYYGAIHLQIAQSEKLFAEDEAGSPSGLAVWLTTRKLTSPSATGI